MVINMNILLYRYGSICEPDIIDAFQKLQVNVIEEKTEMTNKKLTPADQVALVAKNIDMHHPLFVFSINFFPAIAEVCHIYKVPYLCWTVDSPVLELFSTAIQYDTNRIFLFDRAQYEYFAPYNPDCIFYLPLASAVDRFDRTLEKENKMFQNIDISFVGSLYSEKNKMNQLSKPLPEFEQGYIDGIVAASLKVYGYNFIEPLMNPTIINAIKERSNNFYSIERAVRDSDAYVAANDYVGIQVTQEERIQTLNTLAQYFKVDLYTRSDISPLKKVQTHDGISSLNEMPFLFRNSKINLNMTSKSIQTGLPLRIFDIMGCGGFVMTNYQSELPEYFEIGVDLEAYGSLEELVDKCDYYLIHDEERIQIARNGYEKVKALHTYEKRLATMISCISK